MKPFRVLLLLAVAVVLLSSCRPRGDEIRVGAYLSLSGVDASFGTDTQKGVDLAVEQLNAAGGVHGRKVKVLYEDDQSRAGNVAEKVQSLIDREDVVAVLGEVASSRSVIGSLICEQKRVPMVTPSSTAVEVTEERDYTFRACFTDQQQGEVAARFVLEYLKKTRAAVFYTAQDPYAAGLARTFREAFVKRGGTITIDKGYPASETNFGTYLEIIKATNPEIIFMPVYYDAMSIIAKDAADVGIPGSMLLGGDGWDSDDLVTAKSKGPLEGAYFTNHSAPDVPWAEAREFVAAYRARYQKTPNSLAAQGYDAARILFDAMARAPEVTRADLTVALADTHDFKGATGVLTIDEHHNANKPIVVNRITDGEFHYVTQYLAE